MVEKTLIFTGLKKNKTKAQIFQEIRTLQKNNNHNDIRFLMPMYLVDFGEILYANLPKKNERQ